MMLGHDKNLRTWKALSKTYDFFIKSLSTEENPMAFASSVSVSPAAPKYASMRDWNMLEGEMNILWALGASTSLFDLCSTNSSDSIVTKRLDEVWT